jgi:putative ABC transport system ATP-binding protein
MSTPIRTEHLTKVFGSDRNAVRAVDDISLEVASGELALVMGPSGSGKTTLLSMAGGLLTPTSGRVLIGGTDLTALGRARQADFRAQRIGFVFQAFNLLGSLTVEENVLFPAQLVAGGVRAARPRAQALLERLGLDGRRNAMPDTLSGGEKQRVAIARALINDPHVVLADEPTGNLDSQHGQDVLMVLHDLARDERRAVLIVTHDPRAEDVADRILWLEDGKLHDRRAEDHAWVRDPVCGMRVDAWTSTLVVEHAGRRYVFCSSRCVERFTAEPERYRFRGASGAA